MKDVFDFFIFISALFSVYIRYTYLCGVPTYLHCIRLLHFLRDLWFVFNTQICLHLLNLLGWFPYLLPGRVAQSVGHLTRKSGVLSSIRGLATFLSPSAFSRRAVVSYWRKYVHEVLVNRLGGLSLPRKSVVRLTDRPVMTLDVYRGRKTTMQQQQPYLFPLYTSLHFLMDISNVFITFSSSVTNNLYVFALYTFLLLSARFALFFVVDNTRYRFLPGFPICLHCTHLLHFFLERCADFSLHN